MPETVAPCVYFTKAGSVNTPRTLDLVRTRAAQLGVRQVLVASTTGATGLQAAQALHGLDIIVVTHSAGFDCDCH